MTIRLVLVDDQAMVRVGLRMLLESQTDLDIVGEAEDGLAAIELLENVPADVVLMDVRMPRMDGVAATRRIRQSEPAPRVLILTTFDLDEYAFEGLQAGASGFLLKDTPVEDVVAAIHHIHHGDAVVAPSTTRRLIDHMVRSPRFTGRSGSGSPDERFADLTPREVEVLRLVARGMSNAEIAAHLVLAEGTVKVHVGRILGKLEVRDRVQAVVLAYETGLIEAGDVD